MSVSPNIIVCFNMFYRVSACICVNVSCGRLGVLGKSECFWFCSISRNPWKHQIKRQFKFLWKKSVSIMRWMRHIQSGHKSSITISFLFILIAKEMMRRRGQFLSASACSIAFRAPAFKSEIWRVTGSTPTGSWAFFFHLSLLTILHEVDSQ